MLFLPAKGFAYLRQRLKSTVLPAKLYFKYLFKIQFCLLKALPTKGNAYLENVF